MKKWLKDNRGFVIFLLCFGVFRTAVADWNPIPSGSMRPTLLEGDVVFVNRLAYDLKLPLTDVSVTPLGEPQRGDIVTFSSPTDGTRLIKRLVAGPGDTVEMRQELLLINGEAARYTEIRTALETLGPGYQAEAQVVTEQFTGAPREVQFMPAVSAKRSFGPLVVPPGHYFMLGDNRDNSHDSRYLGTVPRALLIGRAERVLVSADLARYGLPRWERTVSRLR